MLLDMLKKLGSTAVTNMNTAFEDRVATVTNPEPAQADPTLADNTDLVRAEPVNIPLVRVVEKDPAEAKSEAAEKFLNSIPGFGLLNAIIRTVFPKGYGTYIWVVILLVASAASAMGHPLPFITVPEDMTGVTGAIAALFWFLRNSK